MIPGTINDFAGTERTYYARNLNALYKHQPLLAAKIAESGDDDDIYVTRSKSGHAVPVFRSKAVHSLDNPVAESEVIAKQVFSQFTQERILFFGFGFGYHIVPFVQKGLSPIVYEPSLALLKLAFIHVDLTPIIPFVTFHTGTRLPDIPRSTQVFTHNVLAELFPQGAAALSGKVITHQPPRTDDVDEGVYYESYRNVTCLKHPCDLVAYQMIFFMVRPTIVLEIGTCRGGSALLLGDLLRILGGNRHLHTYDIVDEGAPELFEHPNVTFHPGGWKSFDPSIIKPHDRVLVIEDSAHTYENTIQVMNAFAPYVTPNSYFIVEDGAAGLTRPEFNGGAIRAIEEFISQNPQFEIDSRWEHFFGTGNTGCLKGFLRRKTEI